ncbi:hypothetical protein D9628_14090, partial [Staphylococcus aureus]
FKFFPPSNKKINFSLNFFVNFKKKIIFFLIFLVPNFKGSFGGFFFWFKRKEVCGGKGVGLW